jgi:hypothetical protein
MTPTPKLRWINRPMPNLTSYVERVLQQWWEKKNGLMTLTIVVDGEWRDVPLEKEA